MADWPVTIDGVVESVVTTRGPNGRYNAAALGLHAGEPVTARTWGRTRTRGNFERQGGGTVQFVADPLTFVEAALGIHETDEPVLDAAHAWATVGAERVDTGESGGTEWIEWALTVEDAGIERRAVPTINRGTNAVIEATVHASRLNVEAYETAVLLDRLAFLEGVVDRCGGERDRRAFERLDALVDRGR